MWTQNLKVDGSYLQRRNSSGLISACRRQRSLLSRWLSAGCGPVLVWDSREEDVRANVHVWTKAFQLFLCALVWVHAPTLTVDDGSREDGSHGGLLRQELDAVQQPGWVHALAQRHVVHRLQARVKVHRKRHQLLALHHVLSGGAPQLATWRKQR